jgi:hypothetical protein
MVIAIADGRGWVGVGFSCRGGKGNGDGLAEHWREEEEEGRQLERRRSNKTRA